jgi:Thioredoxin domain-containing protein
MAFLGKTLVSKSGIINISALDFKNPLLIYFSASWCPPCRMFTPTLAEFYNKLNTPAKQVEVIFATLDENKKEYDDYYSKMPWLSIDFNDKDLISVLSTKYGIQTIPTVVLVNEKGEALSKDCRNEVVNSGVKALEVFKNLIK